MIFRLVLCAYLCLSGILPAGGRPWLALPLCLIALLAIGELVLRALTGVPAEAGVPAARLGLACVAGLAALPLIALVLHVTGAGVRSGPLVLGLAVTASLAGAGAAIREHPAGAVPPAPAPGPTGSAGPGPAGPGSARPGLARPGSARPGSALPGSALPGFARPGFAGPAIAGLPTQRSRRFTPAGPSAGPVASAKPAISAESVAGTAPGRAAGSGTDADSRSAAGSAPEVRAGSERAAADGMPEASAPGPAGDGATSVGGVADLRAALDRCTGTGTGTAGLSRPGAGRPAGRAADGIAGSSRPGAGRPAGRDADDLRGRARPSRLPGYARSGVAVAVPTVLALTVGGVAVRGYLAAPHPAEPGYLSVALNGWAAGIHRPVTVPLRGLAVPVRVASAGLAPLDASLRVRVSGRLVAARPVTIGADTVHSFTVRVPPLPADGCLRAVRISIGTTSTGFYAVGTDPAPAVAGGAGAAVPGAVPGAGMRGRTTC